MKVAYSLAEITRPKTPVVLTIGTFDGVHLGHQMILKHLKQKASEHHAISIVITFSNHPSKVLQPERVTPLLCTIPHKLKLIEKAGIFATILLPFTKEFSEQSAETFLLSIREALPFQTLILGSDAHLGKNREGNRTSISDFARAQEFAVEYLEDMTNEGERISSRGIRDLVQKGKFEEVEKTLGRPYSIYSKVLKGSGKGGPLGFPTANLSVKDLCLPPFGVYAVNLREGKNEYSGVANLGFAPTMHEHREPFLEVHLFDLQGNLYDKFVEVRFIEFIRKEMKFDHADELKKQISLDVIEAKRIAGNWKGVDEFNLKMT